MAAGREATPKDVKSTERLMVYWTHGKGAAKIGWGTPGDYDKCLVELGKYVSPGIVHGLCANLHKRATGGWPGHAPGTEEAMAKAKQKGG
jgi:hypothetical protein